MDTMKAGAQKIIYTKGAQGGVLCPPATASRIIINPGE